MFLLPQDRQAPAGPGRILVTEAHSMRSVPADQKQKKKSAQKLNPLNGANNICLKGTEILASRRSHRQGFGLLPGEAAVSPGNAFPVLLVQLYGFEH